MKANEVLQRFFKKHGTKHLAQTLKLSEPFLYKWCQPDGGKATGGWNPLARVAALTEATDDDELLDWLCAQRGGRFVRRAELPALARQYENQFLAEVKRFFQSLVKPIRPALRSSAERSDGAPNQPGGSRCRFRLAGHRCGFPHAARN